MDNAHSKDTPEQTVKNMTDYVETIKNGGMQSIQCGKYRYPKGCYGESG